MAWGGVCVFGEREEYRKHTVQWSLILKEVTKNLLQAIDLHPLVWHSSQTLKGTGNNSKRRSGLMPRHGLTKRVSQKV